MAEFSETLITPVSTALQSADIPYVLWGHCLLNTHGVPSIIDSVDFIVPDGQLQAAASVLSDSDTLEPCPDINVCLAGPHNRCTPPAAHHVHVHGSKLTVDIFIQSETLWFLPELDQSLVFPPTLHLHAHFVFASDKHTLPPKRLGRGSGAFQEDFVPVLVPRAVVLLEAFLRIYARDRGKQIGSFAMQMICYIEEYVDDEGYLRESRLPEPLQTLYVQLKEDRMPVRQWLEKLRAEIGVQPGQDVPEKMETDSSIDERVLVGS
ncbi:hypothetical protein KC343_g5760 [Hortaea werneckii]|nr:hypothetical protein KC352_g12882 [Hortaea werneckii]KAI7566058.1 hypothetical protein KC317_g5922 [Hortaea werneckii]KAI7617257.1 hypothetical protein KC346_g5582 [Hortaea werneckii]KAI7628220.1 hypothetical protein KC343_g5760 [Hortaea werneckii]KAI7671357.1 hypothetical protein KC319_g5589 [Hortaea werneckii]